MKLGTKSVLFGAHTFWLHPWFVALAWWRLYGFPWAPWLWVAFWVHDLGYWGKPNMDGPEGEEHPWTGARILYWLQGTWLYVRRWAWCHWERASWERPGKIPRWNVRRRWAAAHLAISREPVVWGNEALYHSRYLAKRYGVRPSRLCVADKLAIALTPGWLYLPLVHLTGEIHEYMGKARERHADMPVDLRSPRAWYAGVREYCRRWAMEHRDGQVDTWTASRSTQP